MPALQKIFTEHFHAHRFRSTWMVFPIALVVCWSTVFSDSDTGGESPGTPAPKYILAEGQQGFIIPPHLNNITTDGVTLIWETAQPERGKVEYGLSETLGMTLEEPEEKLIHRVRITGLTPETVYHYRIQSGVHTLTSTFKTAPGTARPITFVMIGDSRRWGNRWAETKMGEHAAQWNPEFYLIQGDLVLNGHDKSLWPEHFNRFAEINHRLWLVTARGNHEGSAWLDTENDWFAKYHELPGGGEPFASFTWGNTFFAIISWEQTPSLPKWMDEVFPKINAQYRIVVHHFPVYCTGYYSPIDSRKEISGGVMGTVRAALERHNVTFDLAGHTHIYERTFPLRNDARNDAEGIIYVINGGDCGANFPEWFDAVTDNDTLTKPTYTVFHMGEDRAWFRTFAWSTAENRIEEIDYVIKYRDEEVPKSLVNRLGSLTGEERIQAIRDLGAMMYQPAAEVIAQYLTSDTPEERRAAAHAICCIAPRNFPAAALNALDDSDVQIQRDIARALEASGTDAAFPKIASAAKDKTRDVHARLSLIGALQIIAQYKDELKAAAVKEFEDILMQPDEVPKIRERASYALLYHVTLDDVDTLCSLFVREPEEWVLTRLAYTLNELTGKRFPLGKNSDLLKTNPNDGSRSVYVEEWKQAAHEKMQRSAS